MAHIADGPKITVGDSAKLHEAHLSAAKFEASVISLSFVEVVEDHFKRAYGVESVESRGRPAPSCCSPAAVQSA
jgi:hypothetical protein